MSKVIWIRLAKMSYINRLELRNSKDKNIVTREDINTAMEAFKLKGGVIKKYEDGNAHDLICVGGMLPEQQGDTPISPKPLQGSY